MPNIKAPTRMPYKKLSANEWLAIVNLAEQGMSPTEIAKNFGSHASVIYRGLHKRGVRVGSMLKDAEKNLHEQTKQELLQKIKDTKNQDYRFTHALQEMIMRTIIEAKRNDKTPGSVADDLKALKIALEGIKQGTDNKWRILGLDKDNQDADKVLPELPIREMTDLEVQQIRDRQAMEDDLETLNDEDQSEEDDDAALEAALDEIEEEAPDPEAPTEF